MDVVASGDPQYAHCESQVRIEALQSKMGRTSKSQVDRRIDSGAMGSLLGWEAKSYVAS